MTFNNVRFNAQTYTDRGPTINFQNEYNAEGNSQKK